MNDSTSQETRCVEVSNLKIGIISSLYHPLNVGGTERMVRVLADGLKKQGEDVFVISLNPKGIQVEIDNVNDVRVYRIPLSNIYWPFSTVNKPRLYERLLWHGINRYNPLMSWKTQRILQDEKPDVVHTHNLTGFSVGVWAVATRLSTPIIHTVHDCGLMCPKGMYRNGKVCKKQCIWCNIYSLTGRQLSRKVDILVGPSQFIIDMHTKANFFQHSKKRVVRNAISLSEIEPTKRQANERITLGYLGRLVPGKGVDDLLQAMKNIASKVPSLQLVVGGTGSVEYERTLKNMASGLSVKWLGYTTQDVLFKQVDALVVPSRVYDNFPGVIAEAYMYGIPVIGSNRGGIPEMVVEGLTGWLYDPGVEGELEYALYKVVQRCCEGKLKNMKNHILQETKKYSSEVYINTYCDLYRDVM
jgi:glycosyltransferase involved in cell wall biosynthesis